MAQVKDGSIEAFEELYDRYCDRGLPGGTIDLSGRRARGGSARGNGELPMQRATRGVARRLTFGQWF